MDEMNTEELEFSVEEIDDLTSEDLLKMLVGGTAPKDELDEEIKLEFESYQREQEEYKRQQEAYHAQQFQQQQEVAQQLHASLFPNGVKQQTLGVTSPQPQYGLQSPLQTNNSTPRFTSNSQPSQQSGYGNSAAFYPQTPATPQSPALTVQSEIFIGQPIYQPKPSSPLQPSQQLLADIHKYQMDQKSKIEKMFQNQKQFLQSPNNQGYTALSTEQKQLKEQIEMELRALNQCFDQVIMEPPDLQKLYWLRQDLEIQLKQLELLIMELNQLVTPSTNRNLATLVILKQPFPLVISKNKQLAEEQLQVQLLTASNIHFQSVSQVKSALLCDITHGKGSSNKPLDTDSQSLDPNSRIAKFPLKFLAGTKKAPGHLKFGMQVQLANSNAPTTVESNISAPLVVITNEIQWEGSAGTLLKKEAFPSGQLEITWARFANTLQHHFLKATRQDLARPRRILSQYDLRYFHTKFFNSKPIISQKDFDEFWSWFGKAMQRLRYQRHICSLWQNGLLYGFMTREDVDASLNNQEPGTFIMRFSERHNGQFAIAYTGTERPTKIKHYLVQPNDTAASKKTLPDFLSEQPQFATLLVLTTDSNGNPTFMKVPKDQALEPYCGKKDKTPLDNGYDPL